MKYRIERMEGQHCHFVNGRTELLAYLEQAPAGTVTDTARFTKRRHRFRDGNISAIYQGQKSF